MKKIAITLIILLALSCKSYDNRNVLPEKEVDFSTSVEGEIFKLDSINNYHLIYVSNDKVSYKIISKKVQNSSCKQIELGSTYQFNVIQLTDDTAPSEGGTSDMPMPINHLDFEKCKYFENTEICNEVGLHLYTASNITGLCIVKKWN